MSAQVAVAAKPREPLLPCMVTVRTSDGLVSVLPLLETPIGLAIYAGDTYMRIGQVRPTEWEEENRLGRVVKKKGTAWFLDSPEYGSTNGRETTQKAAVAALLAAAGYIEAPPNAANPGLFDA